MSLSFHLLCCSFRLLLKIFYNAFFDLYLVSGINSSYDVLLVVFAKAFLFRSVILKSRSP